MLLRCRKRRRPEWRRRYTASLPWRRVSSADPPSRTVRILALETSSEYCSCALWHDGSVTDSRVHAGQRHSSLLLPMATALLARAGAGFATLDAIAFGAGPGSFTGVRIACSVAQGLAFARDLPLLPVVTLEALAHACVAGRVIACIDARMGELYLAAYERSDAGWRVLQAPVLVRPDALPHLPGPWHACGSGFAAQPAALAASYEIVSLSADVVPQARSVAELGAHAWKAGGGIAAAAGSPLYLRNKVALDVREQAAARAARKAA